MSESGPICPQCGAVVQPTWDWCHQCGFDPAAPGAEAAMPPPPPPPPPPPAFVPSGGVAPGPSPRPFVPFSGTPGFGPAAPGPASDDHANRGLWIVVGVAVIGLVLVAGLVFRGQSQRHDTAATTATAPGPVSPKPTVTIDPTVEQSQRFLAILAPADDATVAFLANCGCTDEGTPEQQVGRVLAALPPLVAAKQAEADALDALSVGASPLLASHLKSMAHLEAAASLAGRDLTMYGATMDITQVAYGLHVMASDLDQAEQLGAMVRADLGIGTGEQHDPSTPATI